jgi:hypothetical protein
MKRLLTKSLNKKRPPALSKIIVTDFKVSNDSPTFSDMRVVRCCDGVDELIFDIDVIYKGHISIVCNTTLNVSTSLVSSLDKEGLRPERLDEHLRAGVGSADLLSTLLSGQAMVSLKGYRFWESPSSTTS